MTEINKQYYLQDIEKFLNKIDYIVMLHVNHYEILFNDGCLVSIILEPYKFHIDLLRSLFTREMYEEFKLYLNYIIEYKEVINFVCNLYRYYNDKVIIFEEN